MATPGRLWELMRLGEPHLADLSRVVFLVLDEADRMVQQGHFQVYNRPQEPLRYQVCSGFLVQNRKHPGILISGLLPLCSDGCAGVMPGSVRPVPPVSLRAFAANAVPRMPYVWPCIGEHSNV